MTEQTAYQRSGVDTKAGDIAIELMRQDVQNTHKGRVIGGVGGFAGLFDASALRDYRHPVLATSTDGVGTKIAIADENEKAVKGFDQLPGFRRLFEKKRETVTIPADLVPAAMHDIKADSIWKGAG